MKQAVVEIVGGPRDGERLHVLRDAPAVVFPIPVAKGYQEVTVPIVRRPDGRRVIDGHQIPVKRKRW